MNIIQLINERFVYDEGRLLYKAVLLTNPSLHGKEAGSIYSNGYRVVTIKKKRYPVSHIIWAMHHGELPTDQIDHINHDPLDNRIENLRPATKVQNQSNRTTQSNNTSGYKGVRASGVATNPWRAVIRVAGKYIGLGNHKTKEEAALAYNEAALEYHGAYASLNEIKRAGL